MNKDNYNTAMLITNECERRNINLAGTYETWTKCAFALADLGEQGRELFHRLARLDSKYNEAENNRKFDNALRTSSRVGFATWVYLAKENGVDVSSLNTHDTTQAERWKIEPQCKTVKPTDYIPFELIERSTGTKNNLCEYLFRLFNAEAINAAVKAYNIGSTRAGETLFPQIDNNGRCRTAKVIQYAPTSGHRVKSSGADWLHSRYMRQQGKKSEDFTLKQCLFGEHLLKQRPDDSVCLVEAEKTAFICSLLFPQSVWVATGGQMMFTAERLQPLAGRKVTVFPDADAADEWQRKAEGIPFAKGWVFSDWHKDEAEGSKRDIADLLLEYGAAHPQNAVEQTEQHRPLTPDELVRRWRNESEAFNLLCETFDLIVA